MPVSFKNQLIFINSSIIYIIPFALLTGPFIPDLLATISGILFLILTTKDQKNKYMINSYSLIFLITYLIFCTSSILSDERIFSLGNSFFYFRFYLFSLSVWYLLDINKIFLKVFCFFLLITFLISILDGYYQFINGENIFGIKASIQPRSVLLLDDKMILGGYLSRLLPLLIACLLTVYSKNKKLIFILLFLFISVDLLVYLTGERTALAIMILSTLMFIIFVSKFKFIRLITFFVSITIIISVSVFSDSIRERNIDQTINQLGLNNESDKTYMFSPVHDSHYRTALNIFLEYPLFGGGVDTFRKFCDDSKFKYDIYSCSSHPHNSYFQLLAETGILGTLPILSLFFYFTLILIKHFLSYFKYNKRNRLSDYQVCLIVCFIITLFPFLPTLGFFNNWINVIYYLPIGFYLSSISDQSVKKKNNESAIQKF